MSDLEDSKARVTASRDRITARIGEIRALVQPHALLDAIKAAAGKRAVDAAGTVVSQPKGRALVAIGAVSAGLTYLFRRPLLNALAQRLTREKHDEP